MIGCLVYSRAYLIKVISLHIRGHEPNGELKKHFGFTFAPSTIARVDKVRGNISRSAVIEMLLIDGLSYLEEINRQEEAEA